MKTIRLMMLVALIAIPSSSLAASRGRAVGVRSGFVRPPFAHRVVFPRPFFPSRFVVRHGFAHRIIFPRAFFPFPYVYSYLQPYAYPPYSYGDYTPPYMNYSAQSYSISPPPPPADAYDRGYSEGYAQGHEQAQKERDKDRYEEGKNRGYEEGYEAGKSGQNP
jgi:hypothetical protein